MTRSKELSGRRLAIKPQRSNEDDQRFNDTLKRMLKTPPEPHVKDSETESHQKKKPGGNPAKNDRPED